MRFCGRLVVKCVSYVCVSVCLCVVTIYVAIPNQLDRVCTGQSCFLVAARTGHKAWMRND